MFVMNGLQIYSNYINPTSSIAQFKFTIPYFDGYAHMLLGIFSFCLLYVICSFIPQNRVLIFSDKYSYYIYLVHNLFIQEPFTFMPKEQFSFGLMLLSLLFIVLTGILLKLWSDLLGNMLKKLWNFKPMN